MKPYLFLPIFLIFLQTACERHDFEGPEGTKRLHEHGEAHEKDSKH